MFGAYQAALIHTRKIYSHLFTSTCPVVNRQLECRLWVFTSDMVIMPELCYSPPAVFDPCICNWYRQSLCSDVKLFLLQCLETGGVFTFSCRRSWCALKKWDANVLLAIWNKSERLIHANEWAVCQQEKGCETEFRKMVPCSAPVFLLFHFSRIQMLLWYHIITLNCGNLG